MNPVISGEPAAHGRCKVCGGTLSDTLRCGQCGAAYGEANRCPHCRSVADVEPSGPLRFRCRVCGGPRVPLESREIVRSGREIPVLGQAKKAHLARAGWAVGAGVLGAFGLMALAATLLVIAFGPGLFTSLGLLGASAVPFVLAALAWRKAKKKAQVREHLLDDAWGLVAADVLSHQGKEIEADDLAKLMRIDVARAEQVLAQLSLHDYVHARVTDDGDIAYSVAPEKLRVATDDDAESSQAEGDEPVEQDVEQDEAAVLARARASESKT